MLYFEKLILSACAKGKPSYVLESMNIGRDRADSALRISFSKFNTEADIDALCYGIEKGLRHFSSAVSSALSVRF